ncbi:MAG: tetratricopeptide repeat protein [Ktedonobacteraceae bacterium]|nr:tetratricopeptide repeat protein [Ktedonobacteraceae bacterium]
MTLIDNNFSSFGTVLRTFRKRRRLTQRQLAEALGVHESAIGRWERGDFLPDSKAMVLELARCLHLDEQETRQLLEASLTALAPPWSVPALRNPFFTGREALLGALHARLCSQQAVALTQSYALHGLGGIGKTQLAVEYAYQYALSYSAVFWIAAESREQILSSYLRIADLLQLSEAHLADQQRILTAVQHWLTAHSGWLLIWDNVEELELVAGWLPPARQGTILMTTRRQALGTLAYTLEVPSMESEEGVRLLLRRARVFSTAAPEQELRQLAVSRPSEYAAAQGIVSLMGGLPLALDQAGAYLEETGCGVADYLVLLRERQGELLRRRGMAAIEHPLSVSSTFTLAIEHVKHKSEVAVELLKACAFCAPDAIAEEIFTDGASALGAMLQTTAQDAMAWDGAIEVLGSFSLLHRNAQERTLSMHRLVQVVLVESLPEPEQVMWVQRVVAAVESVFPDARETSTWGRCERLVSHGLSCAQRTQSWEKPSIAVASLLHKTAMYLHQRGQLQEAEPLYQRVLQIREQALGSEEPLVAETLNWLAVLYQQQGKYAEAEPLFQRALQVQEQTLGSEHPGVAHTLHNLAILYYRQGQYQEAGPLFQRALRICEQAFGPEHYDVARPLNSLAILYQEQGKYAEAELLFQRALRICEQAFGPEHYDVARPLHNLAELYREQGKYVEAELLFQRTLRIWERALGAEHPDVAYPLHNLAELYREQEKYTEAEPLFRRALRIREQTFGLEHLDVAYPLDGLADLYRSQGQYEQAEPLYQRALRIREQRLGPQHPLLAYSFNGLATLYREQSRDQEAESLYQQALDIREQHQGLQHPDTAQTLHDLAILHEKQDHLDEATALAHRALSIRSKVLGDTHPKTIATRTLCIYLGQARADVAGERGSEAQTSPRGKELHCAAEKGYDEP